MYTLCRAQVCSYDVFGNGKMRKINVKLKSKELKLFFVVMFLTQDYPENGHAMTKNKSMQRFVLICKDNEINIEE